MKTTKAILTELGACSEAVKWAGRKTHKQAWETCKRGDWLLWIADRFDVDRKLLVLAACGCARTVLKYVPVGEDRPRIAIETAEAWTRGEAMIDQVRSALYAAAYAAYAAADAASAAHALYAAEAAAYAADAVYAAYAVDAAVYAAHAADDVYAVDAAVYAAHAADDVYTAAHAAAHKNMAGVVRKIIPFSVIKKAIADYEGKE